MDTLGSCGHCRFDARNSNLCSIQLVALHGFEASWEIIVVYQLVNLNCQQVMLIKKKYLFVVRIHQTLTRIKQECVIMSQLTIVDNYIIHQFIGMDLFQKSIKESSSDHMIENYQIISQDAQVQIQIRKKEQQKLQIHYPVEDQQEKYDSYLEQYTKYFEQVQCSATKIIHATFQSISRTKSEKLALITSHESTSIHYDSYFSPILKISQNESHPMIVEYLVYMGKFKSKVLLLNIDEVSERGQNKLGAGGFGSVYTFMFLNDQEVAYKRISFEKSSMKVYENQILRNYNFGLTQKINDTIKQFTIYRICQAFGIGPKIYDKIGFDLICFRDCIQFYLEKCQKIQIGEKITIQLYSLRDIKLNLRILHKLQFIHKDIKRSNIMYSLGLSRCVFIDFGISHPIRQNLSEKTKTQKAGTKEFMSPDMASLVPQTEGYVNLYHNDMYALKLMNNEMTKFIKLNHQIRRLEEDMKKLHGRRNKIDAPQSLEKPKKPAFGTVYLYAKLAYLLYFKMFDELQVLEFIYDELDDQARFLNVIKDLGKDRIEYSISQLQRRSHHRTALQVLKRLKKLINNLDDDQNHNRKIIHLLKIYGIGYQIKKHVSKLVAQLNKKHKKMYEPELVNAIFQRVYQYQKIKFYKTSFNQKSIYCLYKNVLKQRSQIQQSLPNIYEQHQMETPLANLCLLALNLLQGIYFSSQNSSYISECLEILNKYDIHKNHKLCSETFQLIYQYIVLKSTFSEVVRFIQDINAQQLRIRYAYIFLINTYHSKFQHLEIALPLAQQLLSMANGDQIALVLQIQSKIYQQLHQFQKAIGFQKEALLQINERHGKQSQLYAYSSGRIIFLSKRFTNYQECVTQLNEVTQYTHQQIRLQFQLINTISQIQISDQANVEKLINQLVGQSPSPELKFNLYKALASYYQLSQHYDLSIALIGKMLEWIVVNEGKFYHAANLHIRMAKLYLKKLSPNGSVVHIEKALGILEKLPSFKNRMVVAQIIQNLANNSFSTDRIGLQLSTLQNSKQDLIEIWELLVVYCKNNGQLEAAKNYSLEGFQLFSKESYATEYILFITELAHYYFEKQQINQSLGYLQLLKHKLKDTVNLLEVNVKIGICKFCLGMHQQSFAILDKIDNIQDLKVAYLKKKYWSIKGFCYIKQELMSKAAQCFQQEIMLYSQGQTVNRSQQYFKAKFNLAKALYPQRKSLELCLEVIENWREVPNCQHDFLVSSRLLVIEIQIHQHKYEDSLKSIRQFQAKHPFPSHHKSHIRKERLKLECYSHVRKDQFQGLLNRLLQDLKQNKSLKFVIKLLFDILQMTLKLNLLNKSNLISTILMSLVAHETHFDKQKTLIKLIKLYFQNYYYTEVVKIGFIAEGIVCEQHFKLVEYLAESHFRLKNLDQSLKYYQKWEMRNGNGNGNDESPYLNHHNKNIAEIWFAKRNHEQAIKYFQKIYNNGFQMSQTYSKMYLCYQRLKKPQQAIQILLRWMQIEGSSAKLAYIHLFMGREYQLINSLELSESSILKAMELSNYSKIDLSIELNFQLGRIYRAKEKYPQAIKYHLQVAIKKPVNNELKKKNIKCLAELYFLKRDYLTSYYYCNQLDDDYTPIAVKCCQQLARKYHIKYGKIARRYLAKYKPNNNLQNESPIIIKQLSSISKTKFSSSSQPCKLPNKEYSQLSSVLSADHQLEFKELKIMKSVKFHQRLYLKC